MNPLCLHPSHAFPPSHDAHRPCTRAANLSSRFETITHARYLSSTSNPRSDCHSVSKFSSMYLKGSDSENVHLIPYDPQTKKASTVTRFLKTFSLRLTPDSSKKRERTAANSG